VAIALVAVGLFATSWGLLHRSFYARDQIIDTPVYQRYGDAMAQGKLPYLDFSVEYPPGALAAFVIPALGHDRADDSASFRRTFDRLMLFCGCAALLLAAVALRGLGAGTGRFAAALAFIALAPLALGSVLVSRYDLWPSALAAGAIAALAWGRLRLGSALLALGTVAKLYPIVLLPLVLTEAWRRGGRREAARCGALFLGVFALVLAPFVALSPGGMRWTLARQLTRPLQIESLGSSFLLAAHQAFGLGITMRSGAGSQNLVGTAPNVLAVLQSIVAAAVLIGLWVAYARGPRGAERLIRYSAAAVCAFVAFDKVLSPQFLIWLIPIVPLVRGRRGLGASALLLLALVVTQLWFPFRYWDLVLHFDALASWLVPLRDLLLLGVLAVLLWPTRRQHEPARTP
jgi:Glycosyltransferase family 87